VTIETIDQIGDKMNTININRKLLEEVDLISLIEQHSSTRFEKPYGNGYKRTQKGACPWCSGRDRFAVFVNDRPQRYKCGIHGNGCGKSGDAITFLREYENMSFAQAYATLAGGEIDMRQDHGEERQVQALSLHI
jgi:DNA primase